MVESHSKTSTAGTSSVTPPANLPVLSKELSERIPAEVWRLVAFHTIDQYYVRVTDSACQQDVVMLSSNDAQSITNMQMVSKAFNEGVRSGFRDSFSGRVYFGKYCPIVPVFVNTILARRLTWLNFSRHAFGYGSFDESDERAYADFNEAILSQRYPNLRTISFASQELQQLDKQECLDGLRKKEILEEAEAVKVDLMELGMTGIDEMKRYEVRATIYLGKDNAAYAAVNLCGELKINRTRELSIKGSAKVGGPRAQMGLQKFIRLSARSEHEALETLELTKLQQAQLKEAILEEDALDPGTVTSP